MSTAPHLTVEFDGRHRIRLRVLPHVAMPSLKNSVTLTTPVSPFLNSLTSDNTFVGSTSVSFLSYTPVCLTTYLDHQDLEVCSLSLSLSAAISPEPNSASDQT